VVTTGQQPGLFGGPLYTWFKALSALALADRLQAEHGIPVAPVFWAATDDADFAEAAVTWAARAGGAARLELPVPDGPARMLAEVPLGDVSQQFALLESAAGSAADRAPLDAARWAYRPDATVGGAYLALLRQLLDPLGIAVLDASHAALRSAADPMLRRALREATAVDRVLAERTVAVEAAGYRPQVPLVSGLSLVFRRAPDGSKERVRLSDAERVAGEAATGELSANVLLRPVLERALLPTLAYVAGPGEVTYFAQANAVAGALGVPQPLVVPRWSGTIIEPQIQALLHRLDLRPDDLRDPHAAERRFAREAVPAPVQATLAELRAAIDAATAALAALEGDARVVVPEVPMGAGRQLQHRVARLERRYVAAARRRAARALHDVATVRGALYPDGMRQERALNLLPLLARHGPMLMGRLRSATAAYADSLVAASGDAVGTEAPADAVAR
jgi:bacillithiol biosynthesis cysteine-adding enzyme BshC